MAVHPQSEHEVGLGVGTVVPMLPLRNARMMPSWSELLILTSPRMGSDPARKCRTKRGEAAELPAMAFPGTNGSLLLKIAI